ncbi:MAG: hypothetical protein ACRDGF_02395 [Chloroflexota bacterium]
MEQLLLKGTVRAFDAGSWTATVQMDGSLFVYLSGIPVSRGLSAAEVVAGATAAVAVFDASNSTDALVVGVW